MKRDWTKPQLLVIARNRPEERVLGTCKGWPIEGEMACDWMCEDNDDTCSHLGCLDIRSS